MTTASTDDLYAKQNKILVYAKTELTTERSTNDRKNDYERQKIAQAKNSFGYLFTFYYILAFITLYFLYITPKYSFNVKALIVAILAIYPFVISTIEYFIYDILYYLYAIIFSIPHRSKVLN